MDKVTLLSILPPIITIAFAIWSKKILLSLLLGLLVGSYLLNPSVLGGVETAIENMIKILSDKDNLQEMLFLYLFSGLIALIRKAGGIYAFSNSVCSHLLYRRGLGGIFLNYAFCNFSCRSHWCRPVYVGAVITGETFGDVTSPVAGKTNMSSTVAHADHTKYLKYAIPYNFISAGITAILFLIAGFFYSQ